MYEEIVSGRSTRERKLAICSGSAPLDPAERAELLTVLAEQPDELVRKRAEQALLSQPVECFVTALQGDAPAVQLFQYCGRNLIDNPPIASALVRNRRCPVEFLTHAARILPTSAVQDLMKDLDWLCTSPALVSALLKSASLTADQHQQLEELLRDTTEDPAALAETLAGADIDQERRATLVQRLSKMRVVERVQLALKGNRDERMALIRDPCKVVQRAVLQSSQIADSEAEAFAAMATLSEEALRIIGTNRNFLRNYTIVRNLINNPKTPLEVSLHLLPNIMAQDLKALTTNKNVGDGLRTAAVRLHRKRIQDRQDRSG